ncbi:hypothetical protein L7F22_024159 [Adiantum nelumboides]|nr:hypothetical protein [Adiantum nelumboides]
MSITESTSNAKDDEANLAQYHLAACEGHTECLSLLINKGADVNRKDNFGVTPLFDALRAGQDSTAQILVESGAKTHLEDAGIELCRAAASGDIPYLSRLVKYGVDPNASDYGDRTPLHVAAAEGNTEAAAVLVREGADVLAKDRRGFTPLDEARVSDDQATIRTLKRMSEEDSILFSRCRLELVCSGKDVFHVQKLSRKFSANRVLGHLPWTEADLPLPGNSIKQYRVFMDGEEAINWDEGLMAQGYEFLSTLRPAPPIVKGLMLCIKDVNFRQTLIELETEATATYIHIDLLLVNLLGTYQHGFDYNL